MEFLKNKILNTAQYHNNNGRETIAGPQSSLKNTIW